MAESIGVLLLIILGGAIGLLLLAFVAGFVGFFLALAFGVGLNAAAEMTGFKR